MGPLVRRAGRRLARGIYPPLLADQGLVQAALGGALQVRSRPGEGTTLSGELPVSALG